MKEKLKRLFSGFDATVGCYMLAGMLVAMGIAEVATGNYIGAFSSFLYTFIVFLCTQLLHQNKHLKRLLVMQHTMIKILEDMAGIKHKENNDRPEPTTLEEAQGEKKED